MTAFDSEEDRLEALENIYETINDHIEAHFNNTHFFNCDKCQLTFISKKELLDHLKNGHNNHSSRGYKAVPGYSVVSMKLSPPQKLVVQKYNKRSKLAVFENAELPIEQMGIKKIKVSKFRKRFSERKSHKKAEADLEEDTQIDYPLLTHLLKSKFIFKKQKAKYFGKSAWKFAKLSKTSAEEGEDCSLSDEMMEPDFQNCFISDGVFLVKPTKESERVICGECLEPFSHNAPGLNRHFCEEIITCDFPGCFFKTMCIHAFQIHNHDDLGTRKAPLILVQEHYDGISAESCLWICANCAEYFDNIKSFGMYFFKCFLPQKILI